MVNRQAVGVRMSISLRTVNNSRFGQAGFHQIYGIPNDQTRDFWMGPQQGSRSGLMLNPDLPLITSGVENQ
jgi:hypothetical protein